VGTGSPENAALKENRAGIPIQLERSLIGRMFCGDPRVCFVGKRSNNQFTP
jgi:hypothetical protein